jgi:DNA-binding CsgD family transcriptional regulator
MGRLLVGRNRDLAVVGAFVASTANDGGVLMLAGEPGVGKTALLDAAEEQAQDIGTYVLRTAGLEFLIETGFASLGRTLLPLRPRLSALSSHDRGALGVALGWSEGSPPKRMALVNATLALLRHVAEIRPLLIIIDDMQWLDRPSTQVLGMVLRRLKGTRVGVIAAYRTGHERYAEQIGAPEHLVEPLDDAASSALLQRETASLGADAFQRVLSESRGNPLALLELPKALSTARPGIGEQKLDIFPLTQRLVEAFAARITQLPSRTRRALLLKVLDGAYDLGASRAGLPPAGAETREPGVRPGSDPEHLRAAETAGLIRLDPRTGRVAFRHPLIRSAVVHLATEKEVREAHRTLAGIPTDDPDRQAWHLAQTTVEPDEDIASLLEQAAHRMLRRGDALGAVAALSKAAEASPDAGNRSRRIAHAAYIGADVTGHLDRVAQLLRDARKDDPLVGSSLQAAVAAAVLLLNGDGDVTTSHRLLVSAIDAHLKAGGPEDEHLHEALHTLLMICWFGGTPTLWQPFYAALDGLDNIPRTLALCARTFADPVRRGQAALAELDAAIATLHQEYDPTRIVRIGIAAVFVHRLAECRSAFWRIVRDGGARASAINVLILMAFEGYITGQWDQCDEITEESLRLADQYGYRLLVWPALMGKALAAAHRGDHDTAAALADSMANWAGPRGVHALRVYVSHIRAEIALVRGDFDQAYGHLQAIWPAGALPAYSAYVLWVALDVVEAAVGAGRLEEARCHTAALQEARVAALSPRYALIQDAAAAMTASDPDRATALFELAVHLPDADRWPLDLARIRLAYGEHLRRTGAVADAVTPLMAAYDVFQRLGAHPWAARTRRALRASGHLTEAANGTAAHAVELTDREWAVAQLAAQGLHNKDIAAQLWLSPRTVGNCLYRLFPKLGITSRAGLRDALAQLRRDAGG